MLLAYIDQGDNKYIHKFCFNLVGVDVNSCTYITALYFIVHISDTVEYNKL